MPADEFAKSWIENKGNMGKMIRKFAVLSGTINERKKYLQQIGKICNEKF